MPLPEVPRGVPRVVFFNPSLYPIGGMQAWLATLMPDLAARGWGVWLALPDGPFNDASAYLANYPYEPCLRLVNSTGSRLGRLRAIQRALAAVEPDLLVVAHLVSAYPAVADLRARGRRAPRVVTSFHAQSPGLFADLARYREVVDAVVAPNRLLLAATSELGGVEARRVFLGPYGIEVPAIAPDLSGGGLRLEMIFAHRLEDGQKRLRDLPPLVEALERRGVDFTLEVAGSGPDEERLRQGLAGAVGRGRVRFLGSIPPDELRARALAPGRVLLVTSEWENGPIVALQAMAWGAVVLSSRYLGSRRESFLRHEENALLFDVGDVEAAAEAAVRLTDPALRARLARNAWQAVGARYSRAVSAAAWDLALRRVLELPPSPRPATRASVAPAGRLDRWLGVALAERVRAWSQRPVPAAGPGDAWPHTEGGGLSEAELFARLACLDSEGARLEAPAALEAR